MSFNLGEAYELMSALQKCIRRGMAYESVHFAIRLEEMNPAMLWNRLTVIASEDVGPANPLMPVIIETLKSQYFTALRNQNAADRLYLINAVLLLAESPKSRDVDELLIAAYGKMEFEGEKLPIPDFALDMHTRRGKALGRKWDHWFEEGAKLEHNVGSGKWYQAHKEVCLKYGEPSNPFKKPKAKIGAVNHTLTDSGE